MTQKHTMPEDNRSPNDVEEMASTPEGQGAAEQTPEDGSEAVTVDPNDPDATPGDEQGGPIDVADALKALEEQNLRIRAEFANYKRRVERDQSEYATYLKGEIIKKLLPVLDDFKLMLDKAGREDQEAHLLDGARMIFDKFNQILEAEGLTRIEALGELFDPQIHEALMMKAIDSADQNDRIVDVFQEGYRLNDRLLRPSKVIVGQYED